MFASVETPPLRTGNTIRNALSRKGRIPISQPQCWCQIGSSMDLKFHDGDRQFMVKFLSSSEKVRPGT